MPVLAKVLAGERDGAGNSLLGLPLVVFVFAVVFSNVRGQEKGDNYVIRNFVLESYLYQVVCATNPRTRFLEYSFGGDRLSEIEAGGELGRGRRREGGGGKG